MHLIKLFKTNESTSSATSQPTTAPTSQPTAQQSQPSSQPSARPNLFNLPFGGGNLLNNLNSFGFGNSNFSEVQSQMQQQMMQNPDMMRQMLDNPMVQSLMSNPDIIREFMMSNPQMQSLVEVILINF